MDTENKVTMTTAPPQYATQNPQLNPQLNPQYNPQFNPQYNPQYNPQFNPQYNPQFNPQFSPQVSPGQPAAYPPQGAYPQTNQPNPNVVLVQVPGANPQAICAQSGHVPVTTYGALGILAAIFCFPIGLIGLFVDRRTTCGRCGALLSAGM